MAVFSEAFKERLADGQEATIEEFAADCPVGTTFVVLVGVDPSGTSAQIGPNPDHQSAEGVVVLVVAMQPAPHAARIRLYEAFSFEGTWQPIESVRTLDTHFARLHAALATAGIIAATDKLYVVVENTYSQAASRYFAVARAAGLWSQAVFVQHDRSTRIPVGISPVANSFCDWATRIMACFSERDNPVQMRSLKGDWSALVEQMTNYKRTRLATSARCSGKPHRDDMVQALLFTTSFAIDELALTGTPALPGTLARWAADDARWSASLAAVVPLALPPPPFPGPPVPPEVVADHVAHLYSFFAFMSATVRFQVRKVRLRIVALINSGVTIPNEFTVRLRSRLVHESWRMMALRHGLVGRPAKLPDTLSIAVKRVGAATGPLYPDRPEPDTTGKRELQRVNGVLEQLVKEWATPAAVTTLTVQNLSAFVAARVLLANLEAMRALVRLTLITAPIAPLSQSGEWAISVKHRARHDWEGFVRSLLDGAAIAKRQSHSVSFYDIHPA